MTSLSYRKLHLGLTAAFVSAAIVGGGAGAAEHTVNPRVELGYTADDNYRMSLPGNEIEVSGALMQAQLQIKNTGLLNEFTLTPRVRATYFPNTRTEDSNDYFLSLEHAYKGQRSRAQTRLRYSDQTVFISELPGSDPSEQPIPGDTTDSGRISIRNRRQLIDFLPSYEHDFSERRRLELQARYLDVSFDRNIAQEQTGFQQMEGSVGMAFARTTRTTLTARTRASLYNPRLTSNNAFGYGLELEWAKQISEKSTSYLRIGGQQTELERSPTDKVYTTDYLAAIGGRWKGPLYEVFVDLARDVGPNASGFMVARDQLQLRWLRRFTQRVNGYIGVRGIRDEALDDTVNYARRTYANGNIGLEWRIRRQISIAASYDHTWQEFADETGNRVSRGVLFSIIYEPNRGE